MCYVYILISQVDMERYIGSTVNLSVRLSEHDLGLVNSTKNRRPLKLYAYQICENIGEARKIEHMYKGSRGAYDRAIKKGQLIIFGE
jgi:putative endonuclease